MTEYKLKNTVTGETAKARFQFESELLDFLEKYKGLWVCPIENEYKNEKCI
jgi:hypothetical protein